MKTKEIKQSVVIGASPKAVFDSLMKEKKHAEFTGESAKIDPKIGGQFFCYGKYISGRNLELVPSKLIVQAWRSQDWPEGHYSLVTYKLDEAGKGKTRITFTQIGVPASDFKAKSSGWKMHYWEPLKQMLEN